MKFMWSKHTKCASVRRRFSVRPEVNLFGSSKIDEDFQVDFFCSASTYWKVSAQLGPRKWLDLCKMPCESPLFFMTKRPTEIGPDRLYAEHSTSIIYLAIECNQRNKIDGFKNNESLPRWFGLCSCFVAEKSNREHSDQQIWFIAIGCMHKSFLFNINRCSCDFSIDRIRFSFRSFSHFTRK